MFKRGQPEVEWCCAYGLRSLALKATSKSSDEIVRQAVDSIQTAHQTIYRAVALDIDGTLTLAGSEELDPAMMEIVAGLLQRGVPVLLVSGRGRSSSRHAVHQIREATGLSTKYFVRLRCITHNGVLCLSTPPSASASDTDLLLRDQQFLKDPVCNMTSLLNDVRALASTLGLGPHDATAEPTPDPGSTESIRAIRVSFADDDPAAHEFSTRFRQLVESFDTAGTLRVTVGTYGAFRAINVTPTTKSDALATIADELGIGVAQILRIGDQGDSEGNDYDLLDSVSGFSVGTLSTSPSHCHPVLNESLSESLRGAAATRLLISRLMIFPPLSLRATAVPQRIKALRSFDARAHVCARIEQARVRAAFRDRLSSMLNGPSGKAPAECFDLADVFDEFSGGIRIRDWELDDLDRAKPLAALFELSKAALPATAAPAHQWYMFTDSAILLRGPMYYYALTHASTPESVLAYIDTSRKFLGAASFALSEVIEHTPTLLHFKLLAGLMDNVRNILIQLQYATFIAYTFQPLKAAPISSAIFRRALVPHSAAFYEFLFGSAPWRSNVARLQRLLDDILTLFLPTSTLLQLAMRLSSNEEYLRRWREADSFIQHSSAAFLGMRSLADDFHLSDNTQVAAVGIVYGGTELPAIAEAIAPLLRLSVVPGICRTSMYKKQDVLDGPRDEHDRIRAGDSVYRTELLQEKFPLLLFNDRSLDELVTLNMPFVLMDDNVTTGRTLQIVRDCMVLQGANVIGAIAVQFPQSNRELQMRLPDHGFPDPDMLGAFVRGLVASTPYSRLLREGDSPKERYLDERKIFNKARKRIEDYLAKNGTPSNDSRSGVPM